MKAMASRAIAATVCGTLPPDAPTPRLSKAMTRCSRAMPSITLGSQSSSTAVKWCRKTTGTSEPVPSSRYANSVPPTSTVRVGTSFQTTVLIG
jgi:hypothetical protein